MEIARNTVRLFIALAGLLLAGPGIAAAEDPLGVYTPGGWASLHRSPSHRKLVPGVKPAERYRVWTALSGASVLVAPTTSPDGRTLYVTTGKASGHANLHAFDIDGAHRWSVEPWSDASHGLDPCAILSSPIVDREGDIYVNDCNQLFAFRPDGSTKWVAPLPPLQPGDWMASEALRINALTTALFTRAGHVFGVTNFGDVVVFDRATGRSLGAPMRLPGLVPGPTKMPRSEAMLSDGLVDPDIKEWIWQLIFGGSMRSANTPSVDLASGRIYVAATSTREGMGALYALEPSSGGEPAAFEIAWVAEMGIGSGSSPALSPARDVVYVSDEAGVFYAIDAKSGAIRWTLPTKATAAAAAVGANGDVYALQAFGPALIAMKPDGSVRWESDLETLARAALPSSWLLGDPVTTGNGNPTVIDGFVLVPVLYGYETTLGRRIPWPVASALVAVDVETGRGVRDVVALVDDSSGITGVLPDGTIVSSLGTLITSSLGPLSKLAGWLLPEGHTLVTPVGGIQVSRPEAAK